MTSKLNISSGSSGGQQVTQHPTRRLDQTAVSMWMILGQSNQTLEILAVKYNRLRIYIDSLSFPLCGNQHFHPLGQLTLKAVLTKPVLHKAHIEIEILLSP